MARVMKAAFNPIIDRWNRKILDCVIFQPEDIAQKNLDEKFPGYKIRFDDLGNATVFNPDGNKAFEIEMT